MWPVESAEMHRHYLSNEASICSPPMSGMERKTDLRESRGVRRVPLLRSTCVSVNPSRYVGDPSSIGELPIAKVLRSRAVVNGSRPRSRE